MPYHFGGSLTLEDRRSQIAELYVKGWTQTEIANHLSISQTTVCFDLKALRSEWREQRLNDTEDLVSLELQKLDKLEREAWSAWERSQKPAQEAETITKDGTDLPTKKKIKGQSGDARYLAIVANCIQRRCELLGLDKPKKLTMNDQQVDQFIMDEVERLARALASGGGGNPPAITVEAREVGPGRDEDDPHASPHNGAADSNGHSSNGSAG